MPSGQLAHGTAPAVPREVVEAALARTHKDLGTALSEEQREAALGICTSGRGAEIVIGVAGAGAGKTTMLRAVAEAFERSGHQVLGTATSGQAAHNLAREAGIGESRTLASLIWRLEGAILERRRVVEELAARNERQVSRERLMAERGQTIERAASGLSMALDGYLRPLDSAENQTLEQVRAPIQRALRMPAAPYHPSVSHDPGPDL